MLFTRDSHRRRRRPRLQRQGRTHADRGPTLSHWQRKIALQKWAVSRGRFGQPSGIYWGLDGDGPRFRPPEGSFVNFLAQMTNTVLRSRREKVVPCHIGRATRPLPRIALSTRQEGLMRLMMAWAHDWRCIPSSLANKIPGASICRGTFLRENIVPPAMTTSPIDRPFDRRGRLVRRSSPTGSLQAAREPLLYTS